MRLVAGRYCSTPGTESSASPSLGFYNTRKRHLLVPQLHRGGERLTETLGFLTLPGAGNFAINM